MFFANSTQEVSELINMCGSLFFESNEVTKDRQKPYNIRQFYQRNQFLGFYTEYIIKVVDCFNPAKLEDVDDESARILEDHRYYFDKCQNFID